MYTHDRPVRGAPVFTIDGRRIGAFIEERDCHYHIDIAGAAYWLPESALWQADGAAVVLICDLSGVERYAVPAPAA